MKIETDINFQYDPCEKNNDNERNEVRMVLCWQESEHAH